MFNFDQLTSIYFKAYSAPAKLLAFNLNLAPGKFVFLMFFDDAQDSDDRLFVFLGRTKVMLRWKLYGNHKKGDFLVYPSADDVNRIRDELGIKNGHETSFDFLKFLEKLNKMIPQQLPENAVKIIREHKDSLIKAAPDLVDEANKIFLTGIVRLPPGRSPREKTLRKLYLYVEAPKSILDRLIAALKRANCTLAWSSEESRGFLDLEILIRDASKSN
jgi:hypothetical protein